MKTQNNEGRLSRWSRRKQQTLEQTQQEDLDLDLQIQTDSAQLPETIANELTDNEQPESDLPILTDEDMPSIETLNSESDFSMFMSSGVTDKLRNLALKQLFKAPLFNIRDGLDEYDEDYTFFEKLGDTVTCDMKHQIEMEALKKEIAEAEADKDEALSENNEDDLVEDGKLEDDGANNDESGQKENNIEPEQIVLIPLDLDQIPTEPEIKEDPVVTKGES